MFLDDLFQRLDQIIVASARKHPENSLMQATAERIGSPVGLSSNPVTSSREGTMEASEQIENS